MSTAPVRKKRSHPKTAANDQKIWDLRTAGVTVVKIAETMQTSRAAVYQSLERTMQHISVDTTETVVMWQGQQIERLDKLTARLWPLAMGNNTVGPDYRAVDRILAIEKRRAELQGLDAPKRVDSNVNGLVNLTISRDDADL